MVSVSEIRSGRIRLTEPLGAEESRISHGQKPWRPVGDLLTFRG